MHIYVVSTVFKKSASNWERYLKRIEDRRDFMFHGYKPLREAIVSEMQTEGSGIEHLDAYYSEEAKSKQDETIRRKSYKSLKIFTDKMRSKFGSLKASYIQTGKQEAPATWEGHTLTGGFHFSADNTKDSTVYVYMYCSDWSNEQLASYLELLAICAENRYQADRKQVWFMDFNEAKIIHPPKAFKNTRKELLSTIEHLDRLKKAIDMEEE